MKIKEEDALRMRVLKVKSELPKGFDYTPIYQYEFGKQHEKHLMKVRMVWNLRATDEEITARLEAIAEHLRNS